jgi:hypothetical protein
MNLSAPQQNEAALHAVDYWQVIKNRYGIILLTLAPGVHDRGGHHLRDAEEVREPGGDRGEAPQAEMSPLGSR